MLVTLNNIINLIWRKKHKIDEMIKNTQQPKTKENPNIVDIKSVNTGHPKIDIIYPRL